MGVDLKMLYLSGFNGFGQCSGIMGETLQDAPQPSFKKFVKVKEYAPDLELSISWCNILLMSEGRIIIGGFTNGTENLTEVTPLEEMKDIRFVKGCCTRMNCTLLTEKGECWQFDFPSKCWVNLSEAELCQDSEEPINLVKIQCGDTITLALSNKGVVYRMGEVLSPEGMRVKDIACGREHGMLLTEDGFVYTIGGSSRGQLGTGSLTGATELCEVEALSGLYIVAIGAGGWHNCAITRSGALYTWGWNRQGQLGRPITDDNSNCTVFAEPHLVEWPGEANDTVVEVSCGTSHTVVKLGDGSIWGCGWNKWGQLATEEFNSIAVMRRLVLPDTGLEVSKIVCGSWNTALVCTKNN